jgi:pimeloyl-ACP methyl ester carboxylesterase
MSSSMWEETTQSLASQLMNTNLVRIDLNGHGKTTQGRKEYTLWDQAQDVLDLVVRIPRQDNTDVANRLLRTNSTFPRSSWQQSQWAQ